MDATTYNTKSDYDSVSNQTKSRCIAYSIVAPEQSRNLGYPIVKVLLTSLSIRRVMSWLTLYLIEGADDVSNAVAGDASWT
jgi:hypothetical protein